MLAKKKISPARQMVKKAFAAKMARKRFVQSVVEVQPTEQSQQRGDALARKARAAKSAEFLSQYRISHN